MNTRDQSANPVRRLVLEVREVSANPEETLLRVGDQVPIDIPGHQGPLVLGRSREVDVQLADQSISRSHLWVRWTDHLEIAKHEDSGDNRALLDGVALTPAQWRAIPSRGAELWLGRVRCLARTVSVDLFEASTNRTTGDPATSPSEDPLVTVTFEYEDDGPYVFRMGTAVLPNLRPLDHRFLWRLCTPSGEPVSYEDLNEFVYRGNLPDADDDAKEAGKIATRVHGHAHRIRLALTRAFEMQPDVMHQIHDDLKRHFGADDTEEVEPARLAKWVLQNRRANQDLEVSGRYLLRIRQSRFRFLQGGNRVPIERLKHRA